MTVDSRGPAGRASPKSRTLICPSSRRMMFSGFKSRWTIPCSCATASASAIETSVGSNWSEGSGPSRNSSRSVRPRTKLRDDVQLTVDFVERIDRAAMAGCERDAATAASRVSRLRRSGSRVYSGGSALIATVRRSCCLRPHTRSPIPPRPDFFEHAISADAACRRATSRHPRRAPVRSSMRALEKCDGI